MRKKTFHLIVISLIVLISACSNDEIFEENEKDTLPDPAPTILLTASIPNDESTTRITLGQKANKSIELRWEKDDKIELSFEQGDTKTKRIATVTNISQDGKKAEFSIDLPEEIKPGKFNLYGVYGGGGLSDEDPTIVILPTSSDNKGSLESIEELDHTVLYFKCENIDTANPQISTTLKHLGSLFNITVKNTSAESLENLIEARLVGVSGENNWAYNSDTVENSYNLVTEKFLNTESAGNQIILNTNKSTVLSGESVTFWAWYPPLPNKVWPELQLELRSEDTTLATTFNSKPERTTPTDVGKCYYFYAAWDGTLLEFTDNTFSTKMSDIKYVNLGDWRLRLITTDKKFIFVNGKIIKSTYDVESCLVPIEFEGEDRFILDDSKLTNMFHTGEYVQNIREMDNGELVMRTARNIHYYTTENQTTLNVSGNSPETIGSIIDGWGVDGYGDTFVYATYSAAGTTGYGYGSVILSTDYGKTYTEVFNVESEEALQIFGASAVARMHIHGVFIDQHRDALVMLLGDYNFDEKATGKLLVLENYRVNRQWKLIAKDFENGMPREQYCAGIALPDCNLYGTDMHETCISRQAFGGEGFNSPRESAIPMHIGLDYIPNFTRPVEPGAPVGIHYSFTGAAGGTIPSSIMLTKDGYHFPEIYTDTTPHASFGNNNARVWCTLNGDIYCTQFRGRFVNELIIGKYKGY